MISYLINYKYYIISTIIIIIVGYILKNKSVEINENKVVETVVEKRKDIELEKLIKSFENSIKKSTQTLLKFNQNNALKTNYLNMRNELFTKDILKTKLLIDSHDKTDSSDSNSDFNIKLSNLTDTFKNVIGFRMIECSIPITGYNINENNNKINIKIDVIEQTHTNSSGETVPTDRDFETGEIVVEFPVGNYNTTRVGEVLSSTIRDRLSALNGNIIISESGAFEIHGQGDYEHDNTDGTARIFDIRYNEETEVYEFFVWNFNNVILTIDLGKHSNLFYRLLGLEKDEIIEFKKRTNNPQPSRIIHHNYSYLDIVIDNIPSIACKINTNGKNVIDRVFVNVDRGTILNYRVPESETQTINYFYPMSLDNINLKIFAPDGKLYDHTRSGYNYFEFEITTLVNTKLMN